MLLVQSERNALLASLSAVVGVVERRHTLPILSNLLLEKKGARLTLLATDLELQISTHLDAQAGEDFAITIAARKLFDIVRALPDAAKVKLDTKDTQVVVSAGKSRSTLQTLPAADFPRVETGTGLGEAIRLPQKTLKRLLQLVQFAMASQDIRYYLNGMLLVQAGNQLRVVATDGHRLSYAETTLENEAEAREVIIPRKTIVELVKQLQVGRIRCPQRRPRDLESPGAGADETARLLQTAAQLRRTAGKTPELGLRRVVCRQLLCPGRQYPSNMLYAKALDAAGRMYGLSELTEDAERIRETIRRQSYEGGFFADNARRVNGKLQVTTNRTEVCQYFAFFFGVASPEAHGDLWKTLLEKFGPNRGSPSRSAATRCRCPGPEDSITSGAAREPGQAAL